MKIRKKDFRELSNKKCVECNRRLKQNLIDKNPDADICYKCKKEKRKKEIQTNYQTVKAPEVKEPIILSNFSADAEGKLIKVH